MCHTEPLQVRLEAHSSEVLPCVVVLNQWFVLAGHVVAERLLEVFVGLGVASLDDKLFGEDVGQFCTKAIPAASHLHFLVVVVARSQKLA